MSFVKSATTSVAPEKSRAEIERMLSRYGAVGFSYTINHETGESRLEFVVPSTKQKDSAKVPVRLPINTYRVYDALYGVPFRWDFTKTPSEKVNDAKCYDAKKLEQAGRVAWRNLLLWVDAALSAVSVGVQTISEAFYAHTLVIDDAGHIERMVDYVTSRGGALAPGVRALLPSSTNGVHG